ncbi:MAG: type I-B CRISPR-associated protein Cas7/Csh2, partial [Candidatus Atribacteria bacterium]|nr:type I-B CRISPR-associated protein Cas7/Csh2 [Candidatus Atribacteria bacterium]
EYRDAYTFLGDLRGKIVVTPAEGLRDIADFELDCSLLLQFLRERKEKIARVLILEDPELKVKNGPLGEALQKALGEAVPEATSL